METAQAPRVEAKLSKNVLNYVFGAGSFAKLGELLDRRRTPTGHVVFCLDSYFEGKDLSRCLPAIPGDETLIIDASEEPTTAGINALMQRLAQTKTPAKTDAVVGIGGGCALDTAKAVSNLLSNGGKAEDYQGWDLVKKPGVFKIGVPTLSGTGAEASRTCVMTNKATGLKLGMNSEHTIYDQLILDPDLTATAPKEQYFFTGMDTYVHCIESLAGSYRNAIGDAFSRQALELCREVFLSDDMRSDAAREKLMVASYLGGSAIANSYVGVVHPFSAGLSVVLGVPHCKANCMTMMAMREFYPQEAAEFAQMAARQGVEIPRGVARGLSEEQYRRLYDATVVHEKPLSNALGPDFKKILTLEKAKSVFQSM